MRSPWPCTFSLLLLFSLHFPRGVPQRSAGEGGVDLGRDLGLEVRPIEPLVDPIPQAALTRVADHVGRPVAELGGARLFTGAIRRSVQEEPCDLVVMPLSGPARGGRLTFAARDGVLLALAIHGALDFDEDPMGRWSAFLLQAQSSWAKEPRKVVLASMSAREVDALLARLERPADEEQRLARALVRQRMAMRKNASLNILLGQHRLPRADWLADLCREMEGVARLSKDLTALLGPEGVRRHGELASELSAAYADLQSLLEAGPEAGPAELKTDLDELGGRMGETCSGCHRSTAGEKDWRALVSERRGQLELGGTVLRVGYDVAPALGDDGKASSEIADKLRAGLLLLEAVRR